MKRIKKVGRHQTDDALLQKSAQEKDDAENTDHRDDQNGNAGKPAREKRVEVAAFLLRGYGRHLFGDRLCRVVPVCPDDLIRRHHMPFLDLV